MNSDDEIFKLAETVGNAALGNSLRVTCAESCTGGWVAKALTDVVGSSVWFDVGFVTYSYAQKTARLGVLKETLIEQGAVCPDVVEQMALGALAKSKADLAVSVSGIAGPGGGSAQKPVGTVWFAWARRRAGETKVDTKCGHFTGDREAIRRASVVEALRGLLKRLG